MDYNAPISADELKHEFDKLKSVFVGSGSEAKFNAAAQMMLVVSRYLSHNIKEIDVFPITSVLGEYARISEGGEPEFIKSYKEERGRPALSSSQIQTASIVAAVDILAKHGYSVLEAIRFVAAELGRKEKQIKQLRSDFNRRSVDAGVEKFKREQVALKFASDNDARIHALVLLEMVKNQPK
ncbi:MAG: hypothetical protein VW162_06970 [Alphaproteobacteria bacterium]